MTKAPTGVYGAGRELCLQQKTWQNFVKPLPPINYLFTQLGKEKPAKGIGFMANDEQYASQYRMGITQIDGPEFEAFGHDGYWGSLMYHLPEHHASFAFFGLNADELLDFDKLFKDIIEAIN